MTINLLFWPHNCQGCEKLVWNKNRLWQWSYWIATSMRGPSKNTSYRRECIQSFVIFAILNAVLWIRNDKSGSSYDMLEFQIQTLPILFRNNRNYWEKKIKFNQKEETTNYKPFSSSHGSTVQCTLYSTPSTEFTHLKLEEFFFIHLLFHVLLDPTEHQLNTITFYGKCAQCYALNTGFAIHITHAK